MKILTQKTQCEYEGCNERAKRLVLNEEEDMVSAYCQEHSDRVKGESNAVEYWEKCINCGCEIPV